jgi:hypothetical protein
MLKTIILILSTLLLLSLGGNVWQNQKVAVQNNSEDFGQRSLVAPEYLNIYDKKQEDYKKYFRKNVILTLEAGSDEDWVVIKSKKLLEKFCHHKIDSVVSSYTNYEQKTFQITNYTLEGEFKMDNDNNGIDVFSGVILKDQNNKKYKVLYTRKNYLDYTEKFEEEYAKKTGLEYTMFDNTYYERAMQKAEPYRFVRLESRSDEGVCLDLDPIN